MKLKLLIASFLIASPALAESVYVNIPARHIFSENNTIAGFYLTDPNLASQCLYGIMYFRLDTDAGKAQFSSLLAAKTAGWLIRRIDYYKQANGVCLATGIHIE
ncbi:MAG TPA: hypothetical protein VEU33_09025 [Archangium sp.]|nr:hypothetical protein [Archangium sp.]